MIIVFFRVPKHDFRPLDIFQRTFDPANFCDKEVNFAIIAKYLNADLKRLDNYCHKWKLKLNQTKIVLTVFSNNSRVADRNLSLKYEGHQMSKENNPVYLGVTMNQMMKLQKHMTVVKEKASRRLIIVKRTIIWRADKNLLRQVYLGYVAICALVNGVQLGLAICLQQTEMLLTELKAMLFNLLVEHWNLQ